MLFDILEKEEKKNEGANPSEMYVLIDKIEKLTEVFGGVNNEPEEEHDDADGEAEDEADGE